MLGSVGVTWIEDSVIEAEATVSKVAPDFVPNVAVIVVDPAATEVAIPLDPAVLLTMADAVFDEVHVADAVRSWLVPSE